MIFNTLIKGGGGITGKPIEVTELPIPTASDVDKIYLLKKEEITYLSPQVGQPIGDKIYFNTELNPLDYTSSFLVEAGTDLLRTETTDEYYSLAFVDILALQGVEGYGHAYIIGVANGALSTIIGITYIYCDVLSVDQFNSMIGSQFGISITEFGWLASEIDTSAIADRIVNTNILPAYDNIAYTSTESTFKEEYYKCVEIKDTIEVGKPVPNILYFDTNKTPDFSGVPVDDTNGQSYFTTQDGWFGVTAISHSDEATGNQGTFEMLAFMFNNNQLPVPLYFGGTVSIDVINAMFSDLGMTFTEKGWQVDGTFNITEKAIEVATNLGIAQDEFMPQLELAFADPVATFNDPQGLFLFPKTYNFEPLGESGFPIEVEELPTATEDDIGRLYAVVKKRTPSTDDKLGNMVLYDTSIVPVVEEGNGEICFALMGDASGFLILSYNVDGNILIYGGTGLNGVVNTFPLYAYSETLTLSEFNALIASEIVMSNATIPPAKNFGWQGDGKLDTSKVAGAIVTLWNDPQGIFSLASYEYYIGKEEGGTYSFAKVNSPVLQGKSITPTNSQQVIVPDSGCDGLSSVTVTAVPEDTTPTITPTTERQRITASTGRYYKSVVVDPVTSDIDENLINLNIKAGVKILDVTGVLNAAPNIMNSVSIKSTNKIPAYAFYGYSYLESVELPLSLKVIGGKAFMNCYNLKNLTIPNGVTIIGDYAFAGCTSLNPITIPNSVGDIGPAAFQSCYALTSILIPNSVTYIDDGAFSDCLNCLVYDFSTHTTVPTLGTEAFLNINANAKIIVPDALYDSWIAATNWSDYASYIIKKSEYTGA